MGENAVGASAVILLKVTAQFVAARTRYSAATTVSSAAGTAVGAGGLAPRVGVPVSAAGTAVGAGGLAPRVGVPVSLEAAPRLVELASCAFEVGAYFRELFGFLGFF